MKKGYVCLAACLLSASIIASGCSKNKEPEVIIPVEETLTAVTVNDLMSGSYYVKNGSDFYELPREGWNFDNSRSVMSTDNGLNGMINTESNRIVDYVYKDGAIPTLYKNDQLVFKSSGNVPSFTWERFLDQGYSIGLYGLTTSSAGKIQFTPGKSGNESLSSITQALTEKAQEGLVLDNGFVLDKINGASLTKNNLRNGGIIAGLTKDAIANCDIYIGTSLVSMTATADTRVFTSFELYTTDLYSNSPDGYAIVDIPDYLKSGYYFINNAGMVKYYNVERGTDTSDIKMDDPYYYKNSSGNVITYYEYLEDIGAIKANTEVEGGAASLEDTPDVLNYNTDVTQNGMTFNISYKFQSDDAETGAKQSGRFPKIILVTPTGNATELASGKNSNDDEWTHASYTIQGAVAGTWQLRFYNFENIYRMVSTDISSGNAKSFIQSGNNGRITIHYDESSVANDFAITWQNKDRAASVSIRTPDGYEYSKDKTPGNLMQDEYGKIVFKLPYLVNGDYTFIITGSELGRVWIDNTESVSLNTEANGSESDNGDADTETGNIVEESESETTTAQ